MAKENEDTQKAMQEGKLKALQAAMSKIEKDFGKGSIMRMGCLLYTSPVGQEFIADIDQYVADVTSKR